MIEEKRRNGYGTPCVWRLPNALRSDTEGAVACRTVCGSSNVPTTEKLLRAFPRVVDEFFDHASRHRKADVRSRVMEARQKYGSGASDFTKALSISCGTHSSSTRATVSKSQ